MQTQIPASIQIKQIVDRTTTIQASVHDVEFTLMLTIALVVMVIFLFLRNFWATLIPRCHGAAGVVRHSGVDVCPQLQPG